MAKEMLQPEREIQDEDLVDAVYDLVDWALDKAISMLEVDFKPYDDHWDENLDSLRYEARRKIRKQLYALLTETGDRWKPLLTVVVGPIEDLLERGWVCRS